MTASPISTALEGTQFFRSSFLSAEDKHALAGIAATPRSLKAGVELICEGVRTDHIYLLTQGWACRYKTTRDGARQITGLVVPGDLSNLDSFMLDRIDFGVRTLTESTVVGLPRDRVRALGAERAGITRAFAWFAIVENAVLSQWALSLGRQTARERLAHLLCEMSARLDGGRQNEATFELRVTQEQIGDMLGLTAVHINRTMNQLRTEGLVVTKGRTLSVPDMPELCRVGGFDATYLHAVASGPNAQAGMMQLDERRQ